MPAVPAGFEPFSHWFEWAFRRFAEKWVVWIVQGLVAMALLVVWFGIIAGGILGFLGGYGLLSHPQAHMPPGAIAGFVLMIIALVLLGLPLVSFLLAGMINTALKQARGEEITVGDLFSAGWATLPVLGAMLLVGIMVSIGFTFFVIPGVILAVYSWLTIPLIVARRLGMVEALGKSFAIVNQNFWLFLFYAFLNYLLIGALNSVGLILSWPIATLLQVAVIEDLYGTPQPEQSAGEQPPWNKAA